MPIPVTVFRCGVFASGFGKEEAEHNWKKNMTELVNALHLFVQALDDDIPDARDHLFDVYDRVTNHNQSAEASCLKHSFLTGQSSRAHLIASLDESGAQQVILCQGIRIPAN